MPKNNIGIDLESVTGQLKHNLWDVFSSSMKEYLSGNKFSQDTLTNILKQQSFRLPVNLPGDYGIDLDFNRSDITGTRKDDFRVTFKKKF